MDTLCTPRQIRYSCFKHFMHNGRPASSILHHVTRGFRSAAAPDPQWSNCMNEQDLTQHPPLTPGKPPHEEYCLWEMESMEFQVGIVGSGPGFMTILDIISNEQYHDFLPMMRLISVCEMTDERKMAHVRARGIPIYPSCAAMLEAHPNIDLIIELVGKHTRIRRMRNELPERISMVDHVSAVFFCGMHNMLQAGLHCRMDLDRHKALLRAVMDEVNEDILLLDKERRVVDMNKNVRQRLASSPGGDKILQYAYGKECWMVQTQENGVFFCPEGVDQHCPYEETLSTGKKAEALITRVNDEGQLVYYRVYSYPVHDSNDNMTHVLILRRNITARTLRERHQQHLDKLALMGELSSYLAHEIRNPLFAIAGFTNSLLRDKDLSEKQLEKLAIIAEETKRLDHMLKSMLDFSRTSRSPMGECNLNTVVEQTVELMRIGYAPQGFGIEYELHRTLPSVQGDSESVKQCLVNLIKNSIEAMPEGGEVVVRTGMQNHFAYVQVQDNGPGMSPETMEKVFSPFFSTKPQGYGMGLAMIKKILDEFGGNVHLASTLNQGTTVTLNFQPILADSASQDIVSDINKIMNSDSESGGAQ